MNVLVAYESLHGSTRSIAENIGGALRAYSAVTTCRMRQVEDLEAFDAFVFGSGEIDRAWLPEACAFLHDHAEEIAGRPVWLFTVGTSRALPLPLRTACRRREQRTLQRCAMSVVSPRDIQVFSGLIGDERSPRRITWLPPRLRLVRRGDFRQWPQIMGWTWQIAQDLTRSVAA